VEFVLGNIVRIDEDVIQIYDDYDVIISAKMSFINLESGSELVSPLSGFALHKPKSDWPI